MRGLRVPLAAAGMAREVQRRRSCVAEFLERRVLLAFSNVGASGTPDRASPAVAAVTAGAVDPPPTAVLVSAPAVSAYGGVYYYYQLSYADNVDVDYQSIVAGNDTQVSGPGGYSQLGTLANLAESAGIWTATYYVTAPGGAWDAADLGTYTIALRADEVKDLAGNFTPAQEGTYRWIASYSGDANNTAKAGACNDANESTTVGAPAPDGDGDGVPDASDNCSASRAMQRCGP